MNYILFIDSTIVISIVIVVIVLLILLAGLFYYSKVSKKRKHSNVTNDFFLTLGGLENIKFIEAKGSRLSFDVLDASLIDELKLKELTKSPLLKTSQKTTIVLGPIASEIEQDYLKVKKD